MQFIVDAGLIILDGQDLNIPIEKLARAHSKPQVRIVTLEEPTITLRDEIFDCSFPKAASHPNPHLWMKVLVSGAAGANGGQLPAWPPYTPVASGKGAR